MQVHLAVNARRFHAGKVKNRDAESGRPRTPPRAWNPPPPLHPPATPRFPSQRLTPDPPGSRSREIWQLVHLQGPVRDQTPSLASRRDAAGRLQRTSGWPDQAARHARFGSCPPPPGTGRTRLTPAGLPTPTLTCHLRPLPGRETGRSPHLSVTEPSRKRHVASSNTPKPAHTSS